MKLSQLFQSSVFRSFVAGAPWMVDSASAGNALMGAMFALQSGVPLSGLFEPEDGTEPVELSYVNRDGIAWLTLSGPLVMDSDPWERKYYGLVDYNVLVRQIEAAKLDPTVNALVLSWNSPGGAAMGCGETARRIEALGKDFPIFSWTAGMMCSAAYFCASGTREIYSTPSAYVGSIGTIMSWLDYSEMFAKYGINREVIASGELKGAGLGPLTEAQRDHYQDQVDYLAGDFKGYVRDRREVNDSLMTGGAYFELKEERKLVDGIFQSADEFQAALLSGQV